MGSNYYFFFFFVLLITHPMQLITDDELKCSFGRFPWIYTVYGLPLISLWIFSFFIYSDWLLPFFFFCNSLSITCCNKKNKKKEIEYPDRSKYLACQIWIRLLLEKRQSPCPHMSLFRPIFTTIPHVLIFFSFLMQMAKPRARAQAQTQSYRKVSFAYPIQKLSTNPN